MRIFFNILHCHDVSYNKRPILIFSSTIYSHYSRQKQIDLVINWNTLFVAFHGIYTFSDYSISEYFTSKFSQLPKEIRSWKFQGKVVKTFCIYYNTIHYVSVFRTWRNKFEPVLICPGKITRKRRLPETEKLFPGMGTRRDADESMMKV